jgi:uncharacterized membrane protein YeiH
MATHDSMILHHLDTLFLVLDFLGVFVGAVGGGIATIREDRYKYDFIGVLGLAFASALGGGITRDIVLQHGPPLAFLDIRYELVAFAGAIVALVFRTRINERTERVIVIVDAVAIGLFAVSGTTRALDAGLTRLPALLLGMVTAVGGGSIRDVLTGRTPKIFEGGQFYALAALLGSAVFLVSDALGLAREISSVAGALACFLLRLMSWQFNWRTRPVRSG